jgi:hypothetical protein
MAVTTTRLRTRASWSYGSVGTDAIPGPPMSRSGRRSGWATLLSLAATVLRSIGRMARARPGIDHLPDHLLRDIGMIPDQVRRGPRGTSPILLGGPPLR